MVNKVLIALLVVTGIFLAYSLFKKVAYGGGIAKTVIGPVWKGTGVVASTIISGKKYWVNPNGTLGGETESSWHGVGHFNG